MQQNKQYRKTDLQTFAKEPLPCDPFDIIYDPNLLRFQDNKNRKDKIKLHEELKDFLERQKQIPNVDHYSFQQYQDLEIIIDETANSNSKPHSQIINLDKMTEPVTIGKLGLSINNNDSKICLQYDGEFIYLLESKNNASSYLLINFAKKYKLDNNMDYPEFIFGKIKLSGFSVVNEGQDYRNNIFYYFVDKKVRHSLQPCKFPITIGSLEEEQQDEEEEQNDQSVKDFILLKDDLVKPIHAKIDLLDADDDKKNIIQISPEQDCFFLEQLIKNRYYRLYQNMKIKIGQTVLTFVVRKQDEEEKEEKKDGNKEEKPVENKEGKNEELKNQSQKAKDQLCLQCNKNPPNQIITKGNGKGDHFNCRFLCKRCGPTFKNSQGTIICPLCKKVINKDEIK